MERYTDREYELKRIAAWLLKQGQGRETICAMLNHCVSNQSTRVDMIRYVHELSQDNAPYLMPQDD